MSLPRIRDAYLTVTRGRPGAEAYAAVWQSKAALSRVYERRHLDALASSSKQARARSRSPALDWAASPSLRSVQARLRGC